MILPTKHTTVSRSLIGIGAVMLNNIGDGDSVTSLWEKVRTIDGLGNFERYILTLDFLHLLGAIALIDGVLKKQGT